MLDKFPVGPKLTPVTTTTFIQVSYVEGDMSHQQNANLLHYVQNMAARYG